MYSVNCEVQTFPKFKNICNTTLFSIYFVIISARTILDHRGTGNLNPKFLRSVLQENVHNFPNVTGIVGK